MVLQFVEEVEEVKGEHRQRAFESRWEPTGAKELNMFRNVAMAITVMNDEAMSARKVEHHEVLKSRGVRTRNTNVVLKLHNEADGGEGRLFKEASIPSLRDVSYNYL